MTGANSPPRFPALRTHLSRAGQARPARERRRAAKRCTRRLPTSRIFGLFRPSPERRCPRARPRAVAEPQDDVRALCRRGEGAPSWSVLEDSDGRRPGRGVGEGEGAERVQLADIEREIERLEAEKRVAIARMRLLHRFLASWNEVSTAVVECQQLSVRLLAARYALAEERIRQAERVAQEIRAQVSLEEVALRTSLSIESLDRVESPPPAAQQRLGGEGE